MAAQVRKDQLIARLQCFDCGKPEFMMGRKRMQQNDWRAGACDVVRDFGVATCYVFRFVCGHDGRNERVIYGLVACCAAVAGAG